MRHKQQLKNRRVLTVFKLIFWMGGKHYIIPNATGMGRVRAQARKEELASNSKYQNGHILLIDNNETTLKCIELPT